MEEQIKIYASDENEDQEDNDNDTDDFDYNEGDVNEENSEDNDGSGTGLSLESKDRNELLLKEHVDGISNRRKFSDPDSAVDDPNIAVESNSQVLPSHSVESTPRSPSKVL